MHVWRWRWRGKSKPFPLEIFVRTRGLRQKSSCGEAVGMVLQQWGSAFHTFADKHSPQHWCLKRKLEVPPGITALHTP